VAGIFILWQNRNNMTIKEAQGIVDNWINTIGVRYYNELTNTAILTEEVGEVARLMARIYGEQSFKTEAQAASAKDDLADEMADVLFVLICLANQTGIDLTEALRQNLDKKTRRDKERHAGNQKLK
jgi:NTP pyrophosphatase (non-canonical NTP hydrolase)